MTCGMLVSRSHTICDLATRTVAKVVKIYVSIYSDDFGKKRAMSNLKRMESYVRREMGQRVRAG